MNKVIYNNFAAHADRYAICPAAGSSEYQSAGNLFDADLRPPVNYATFTAGGINLQDTTLEFAESDDFLGYISTAMSDNTRSYAPAVDLVVEFSSGFFSSPGITFHFWQNYCTQIAVEWYQDESLLASATFYPSSLTYFCRQTVENFNKIIISFEKSEVVNQFVKLAGIDLGETIEITKFHSDIEMFFEINPDAADVPGATCEFIAEIYGFEPTEAQTLLVYGKDQLFGKFNVENVTPNGKNRYLIECVDDAVKLSDSTFPSILQGSHSADMLISKITESSNIDFKTDEITGKTFTGFIAENQTSRIAATMLSFASNCFITSYGSAALKFIKPKNRRNRTVSAKEILGKAEYRKASPYTSIYFAAYSGNFDTISEASIVTNTKKSITAAESVKEFTRFSLIENFDTRLQAISEAGFERSEITVRIEHTGEAPGEIISVETPYNGIKTGIIKSLELSLGHKIIATLTLVERCFIEEG